MGFHMQGRRRLRTAVLALLAGITASCGGCTGKNEQAFCDAVSAGDAATARTLLASEGFNVWARNTRGDCQPLKVVFDEAEPRKPEFTAMALELLKIPGVSKTTWQTPGSSRAGNGGTGSPIISAVANANVPLARAIIAAGVDIMDTQGRYAFTDAVFRGPADMVRVMVEGG